jgi:hypothetical protein
MKHLQKVSQHIKNKFVRKEVQTCIIAKLIKDQINAGLSNAQIGHPERWVEEQIKMYMEGAKQIWKKLNAHHLRLYG